MASDKQVFGGGVGLEAVDLKRAVRQVAERAAELYGEIAEHARGSEEATEGVRRRINYEDHPAHSVSRVLFKSYPMLFKLLTEPGFAGVQEVLCCIDISERVRSGQIDQKQGEEELLRLRNGTS